MRYARQPDLVDLLAKILAGAANLPGAACSGRPEMFDPSQPDEDLADVRYRHRAAATICRTCPALAACQDWAKTQPNDGLVRAGVIPDPRKGRPRKDAA